MKKPLFILPIALSIVRRYPLSLLCIALIWFLSLMPFFPETPFDNVQFIDKWTHLVMYGGTCGVIWWEYLRHHQQLNKRKLLLWPLLGMIALGGVMELLQAHPETTLFVGDRDEKDGESARSVGAHFLLMTT